MLELITTNQSVLVETLCMHSNIALYQYIRDRNVKLSSDSISKILKKCSGQFILEVLNNSPDYKADDVINNISVFCNKYDLKTINDILDTVFTQHPNTIMQQQHAYSIAQCEDIRILESILSKFKSEDLNPAIIIILKYTTSDSIFYYISSTNISQYTATEKRKFSDEFKYSVETMMKTESGLKKLLYLIKGLNIPLEFKVLECFGSKFDNSRFSSLLFDDTNKTNIETITDLITTCSNKACNDLYQRLHNN
jgi:hypothetical protein